MVRRIPIRAKLTVALAVPLAALVVVAALEALVISRESREVRAQSELARSSIGPTSLLRQIQNERNIAMISLLGAVDMIELQVEDNGVARRNTDDAATEFETQIERRGGTVDIAAAQAQFAAIRVVGDSSQRLVELRVTRGADHGASAAITLGPRTWRPRAAARCRPWWRPTGVASRRRRRRRAG